MRRCETLAVSSKERACLTACAFYHATGNNDQEGGYGSLRSVHEDWNSHVRLLNYRG
jgi:hypothetical protein